MNFTGAKDTDFIILQELDDTSLMNFCLVNKYAASLCNDENFWMNRIIKFHGKNALRLKKAKDSYRNLYFSVTYPLVICSDVKKNAKSNLVVEDIYGKDGYIRDIFDPKSLDDFKDYIFLKVFLMIDKKQQKKDDIIKRNILKIAKSLPKKYKVSANLELSNNDINSFRTFILNKNITIESMSEYSILNGDRKYELSRDDYAFLLQIHDGFKNFKLPLTITWSEICTHPYFAIKL
jgi:hypothetical protein